MKYDVSICITSYNRVKELNRCLNSIDDNKHTVEIIISEDKSPQGAKIAAMVKKFASTTKYTVVFNSNENNLGYDRNLGKLIELANGEYIVLISDDDSFFEGSLEIFIDAVIENKANLGYAPFCVGDEREIRRKHSDSHFIEKGEKSVGRYFNDAILFSGLMFRSESVKPYSAERFLNHYYFQVYMFMNVMMEEGAYYYDLPVIWSVCDGENAYGKNESADSNEDLIDRKSVFSNMEFNKGLIKVIRTFDSERNTRIISYYENMYCKRAYMGLSKARACGLKVFSEYWKRLKSLDIRLKLPAYVYYFCLRVFGCKFSDCIFMRLKSMAIKKEQNE